MARKDCDLLIIGSGFGGSVCALRAAQAGLRTIILERGPRITPTWLDKLEEGRVWPVRGARSTGPFDLQRMPGLTALMGSAVGGGSHIYTSVTVRARPEAFAEGWPEAVTPGSLVPHYDRAERMIAPSPIPWALPRTAMMESAAAALGAKAERMPLAVDWPADERSLLAVPAYGGLGGETAAWIRGGHAVRRRSLDRTYLREAEACGVDVRPLHEVQAIEPMGNGYAVHFNRADDDTQAHGVLYADRVILAAGAVNTVRLLLHSRDVHRTLPGVGPALGTRFYTNGDDGGLLIGGRVPESRDAGPLVTTWLDCWSRDRMMLMDVGLLPPLPWIAARTLRAMLGSRSLGLPGRTAWLIGAMGLDPSPLRLALAGRKLVCRHGAGNVMFAKHSRGRLRQLADALGASLVLPPAAITPAGSITVHAMGGARMSDDPAQGVTNGWGRVHGYPGLYVADASLFCGPLGVAPSLTVAAMAEHVMEHLIRE